MPRRRFSKSAPPRSESRLGRAEQIDALYFLALPEETDWPAEVPATGIPLDEGFDTPGGRWLSVIYEAAFAIQAPLSSRLCQDRRGTLRPFQRFVYPITPQNERPSNFRVLSTAEIGESPDLTII